MSVPVSERKLSNLQFYKNAIELRKSFTELLLKDFGLKETVKNLSLNVKYLKPVMDEQDYHLLEMIANKYNSIHPIIERYPYWLVDNFRTNMLDLLRKLIYCITFANSIYPVCEHDYYERRKYQTDAVSCCETLIQEMQYVISILPCNIEKYMPYVESLIYEIKLLKGWRKRDCRFLKAIQEKNKKKDSSPSDKEDME